MPDDNTTLWMKNESDHQEIKTQMAALKETVDKNLSITPLLIKFVILPLVLILGLPLGVERIIPLFRGG